MSSRRHFVTELVERLARNDPQGADELFPLVYDKLHQLAEDLLRRERPDHTLQPTALVNEAYMKLVDADALDWRSRAHFAAIAARAMREVLVDHARGKKADKRGAGWQRITLTGLARSDRNLDVDVLALHEALTKLATTKPRAAQAIELAFFACMNTREIASVIGVSDRTIAKDLTIGQAWLLREMDRSRSG